MSKISLTNLVNLQNETSSVNAINANNAALTTALDNTLSRDGTSPNTMGSALDMNSNAIINLPAPVSGTSPLRLTDASTLNGGGTIANIPAGGATDAVLTKTSGTDFATAWTNTPTFTTVNTATIPTVVDTLVGKATTDTLTNKTIDTASNTLKIAGTSITAVNGTGAVSLTTSPTFVTPVLGAATATSINKVAFTAPATGSTLTIADGKVLTVNNSMAFVGGDGNQYTFPNASATGIIATIDSTQTITNKTYDTAGAGNVFKINGTTISANTGTGSVVLASSPTITTPAIVGTATNDSAAAGNVGEYVESIIATGSATALTTSTAKTVTSISLTAGDWDVSGTVYFNLGATTSITVLIAGLSTTTNSLDQTAGRFSEYASAATIPGASLSPSQSFPPYRLSLSGTTTVYLIGYSTFTASTNSAWGIIRARRIR